MGWYLESVASDAVDKDTDMAECKCLFNHDTNIVLGSISGKQLTLSVEKSGLKYRNHVINTTAGRDTYELIRTGTIDKSSFGFTTRAQKWEVVDRDMLKGKVSDGGKVEIRTIEQIKKLYDVSPVTFPANPDTSVAKRSRDAVLGETEQQDERKYTLGRVDADLRLAEMALQL